ACGRQRRFACAGTRRQARSTVGLRLSRALAPGAAEGHSNHMTSAASSSGAFRVGFIQMPSGRDPRANFDDAAALIRQAKDAGADCVLTPEMTNVMESSRERLFGVIASEERDPSVP